MALSSFFVSLQSDMKHFALIGTSLKHSYSKEYFDAQHFADADYTLCEMPSLDHLRRWVEERQISGFNVTFPFKQQIIKHLDALSTEAERIGAVNCVVVDEGSLTGHNTDAPAFQQMLLKIKNEELRIKNFSQAYILGTGGAAHAVAYALEQLGIPYRFVSRHPEQHPNALGYTDFTSHLLPLTLLINATPVGSPLTPHSLPIHSPFTPHYVYDLNYNPSPTPLMEWASTMGAHTCDGLAMLHLQAELSWHLWGLK